MTNPDTIARALEQATTSDLTLDEIQYSNIQAAVRRYVESEARRVNYVIRHCCAPIQRPLARELTPKEYGQTLLNRKKKRK